MKLNKNGAELESRFNKWLLKCQPCHPSNKDNKVQGRTPFNGDHNIMTHCWLSYGQRDAPMDFWTIILPDINEVVFFDVVDWHAKGESIELNTGHKDWKAILDYCKQHVEDMSTKLSISVDSYKAYITYSPTSGQADDWRFVPINKNLPKGGIYISKERLKHIWGYDAVFGKSERWVYDAEEKFIGADGIEYTQCARIRTEEHSKNVKDIVRSLKEKGLPPGMLDDTE